MSLANSEDPDEMPYNAKCRIMRHFIKVCAVCSDKKKILRIQYFPDIITRDPSNYTMNRPRFTVSNQKEESIYKGLLLCCMYKISPCLRCVGINLFPIKGT